MKTISYKIQSFNRKSGFWDTIFNFDENSYNEAYRRLYNEYKLDNSKEYRFLMVGEEVLDTLFPPGS
jgi:hypothetical protein